MLAALAFPNEDSENVVSDLELGHTFTDTLYYSIDRRCSDVRITSNFQGTALSSMKGNKKAHPDASWPKTLGNRSGCACMLELEQKTDI